MRGSAKAKAQNLRPKKSAKAQARRGLPGSVKTQARRQKKRMPNSVSQSSCQPPASQPRCQLSGLVVPVVLQALVSKHQCHSQPPSLTASLQSYFQSTNPIAISQSHWQSAYLIASLPTNREDRSKKSWVGSLLYLLDILFYIYLYVQYCTPQAGCSSVI
jgi:hypothetical protein